MTTKRLAGLDSAFIAAETPTNHLHMMAVLQLDPTTVPGGYSFARMRDFIGARLGAVPPLRRRLVEVPFGLHRPIWIDEPALDLELHVRRAALPAPGGPRELSALAAGMNGRPLDRSRPLWEMVIVEGLQNGSIAVLAKLHHALMDGISGMGFLGALFSAKAALPEVGEPAESHGGRGRPSDLELIAGALPALATSPLRLARAGGNALRSLLRGTLEGDRSGPPPRSARSVPRTLLNRTLTANRSVAYTALPLAELKAVARTFQVTLNDVVLALVAGALRRYLLERDALPADPLVAGVPASTHATSGDDLANAYAALFPSLATDIVSPAERLLAIHDSTQGEKRRQRTLWGDSLAEWTEVPAPVLFSVLSRVFTGLGLAEHITPFCNVVVSNVPGPPTTLYFGGARLLGIYALGPIFDGVALNVTALSVGASLDVGISACREIVPDPWQIAAALPDALAELVALISASETPPAGPGPLRADSRS